MEAYNEQKAQNPDTPFPSIIATLVSLYYMDYLKITSLKLITTLLPFTEPLLLKQLILFVDKYNSGHVPLSQGISIILLLAFITLLETVIYSRIGLLSNNLYTRLETALSHAIHEKALLLAPASVAETSVGELVNILSNNVSQLASILRYPNMLWTLPLQVTLSWLTMYSLIGKAMFMGMLAMVVVVPVTSLISKIQFKLYMDVQEAAEKRYTLTNNLLTNIKSVKLYAWESTYFDKIQSVRNSELHTMFKLGYLSALESFVFSTCNILSSTVSFAFIVLYQKLPLKASDAIPALSLFSGLLAPFLALPHTFQAIMKAYVALNKIKNFLQLTEVEGRQETSSDHVVEVSGTFFWDSNMSKTALSDISYTANKGDTICIIGKVGTGKTATLLASLGELFVQNGSSKVSGSVAYYSQVPWILNATVKDNILFGSRDDPEFYSHVIEACALTRDFELLADGDQTEVGEKGISLSGGQKARIAIARAVYSRAEVYFFDDPLSAVDEHVQAHLVECVFEGLLKNKTVVMATNTVSLLKFSDKVYLIEGQRFVEAGWGDKVKKLVEEFSSVEEDVEDEDEEYDEDEDDSGDEYAYEDVPALKNRFSLRRTSSVSHYSVLTLSDEDIRRTRVESEVHASESDIFELYWIYFSAAGVHNLIFYLAMSVVYTGMSFLRTYWVAQWGSEDITFTDIQLVLGYLFISVISYFFDALGTLCWECFGALRASTLIHDRMLTSVIHAPMSFFESTPLGRLTTRFSQDIDEIDSSMSWTVISLLESLISSLSALVIVAVSSPPTMIVIVPALYLYRRIQLYYLITSTQVRRLSAATMSPVLSHFQETLTGLTTIRAFSKTPFFSSKNTAHMDVCTKTDFLQQSLQNWLSFRLTAIGVAIFLASGLSLMLTLHFKPLSAGLVGLVIHYASTISDHLSGVVHDAIDVEQESVVLERVDEFSNIESEALGGKIPPAHWPNNGQVTFSDLSTKYRKQLDNVLEEVSFTIRSREKVGVVGRTGAGKSSLTMALFRIIEASAGSISIDGEDISRLTLESLRSRLSIIPQDAQMFEGTIRSNLDPAGKFTDDQLLHVLSLSSLSYDLDTELEEGGSNLSLGQKQLLCLGRALLTPSTVLVLDEATAAVDYETDKVIQETIRREFQDRTILTIAHRLNTVMDSDRIMVLDAGKVVEFDTPGKLMTDKESFFYKLVAKSKE